jgi:hypothetical protein
MAQPTATGGSPVDGESRALTDGEAWAREQLELLRGARFAPGGTELEYRGELGTDLWRVGSWWGELVARPWERTVAESLSSIRTEAERRAALRERRHGGSGAGASEADHPTP